MTEEWLNFIIDCRNGKTHHYDIVIDAMAANQIFNYISDLMNGIITKKAFWELAKFKHPTHQIAFCTKKSKKTIVNLLGQELITNIYALAEIYHAEPIEKVCDEIIVRKNIQTGNYDIITTCTNRIPTHFEIGRTYQALIKKINSDLKNM